MAQDGGGHADVLLVESDPGDADRITSAFESTPAETDVYVVTNEEEAIEFVHQHGEHSDAPSPDFIIHCLHPSSGKNLLTTVKGDPELRRPPVIAMVETDDEEAIRRAYDLSANAYVQKPADPDQLDAVVTTITDFWFETAHLPPKP